MAGLRVSLWPILRIVLPYLLLGAIWILFSDRILLALIDDPQEMLRVSTAKGWLYVLVTGIFLSLLIYNELRRKSRFEAALQQGFQEKSALLFELNHRVKNNLQVLSSIIALESDGIVGDEARKYNNRTKARIRTMALAHERLFESGEVAKIELGPYLRSLWDMLVDIFGDEKTEAVFELGMVVVGAAAAVPFGLFAAEAISNALCYGQSPDGICRASIRLSRSQEGSIMLRIADKGQGIPENASGLGLTLMKALSVQLDGSFELKNDGGVAVLFSFPEEGV